MPTWGLGLLLIAAPLPFGGAFPAARVTLWVGAFVAMALVAVAVPRGSVQLRSIAGPLLALVALAALAAGQGLVGLAVDATAAYDAASAFAAVAALFAASAWGVASRRMDRRWLLAAFVVAAAVQVLWGTRLWLAETPTLWGLEVGGAAQRLRGTFVNPDHFAVFMEIALAVTFAWVWWSWRRRRGAPSLEQRLLMVVVPVLVWLTFFMALAFSGSRAGMAAALGGLAVQGLLVAAFSRGGAMQWRRVLRRGLPVVALAVAGVLLTLWIGAWEGFGRLLTTSGYEVISNARQQVYGASLGLWAESPWWGLGFGGFRDAFPAVQPASLRGLWAHAHNDYLELLICGGLVGLGLLAFGVITLILRLRRVLVSGFRSEDRAAALAALGALAAVGAHELVDFGLLLPANAFALALLCGAAAAVSRLTPSTSGGGVSGRRRG